MRRSAAAAVIAWSICTTAEATELLPSDAQKALEQILQCYALSISERPACFNERSLDVVPIARRYVTDPSMADLKGVVPPSSRKAKDVWLVVTKPMLSCASTQDSENLKMQLLEALPQWMSGGAISGTDCGLLKPGEKCLLDDEASEEDHDRIVKLWDPVCPHGCVPTMTPVYAPSRSMVGLSAPNQAAEGLVGCPNDTSTPNDVPTLFDSGA